jgi:hypothetical protein
LGALLGPEKRTASLGVYNVGPNLSVMEAYMNKIAAELVTLVHYRP